jgi:hypothetical protein
MLCINEESLDVMLVAASSIRFAVLVRFVAIEKYLTVSNEVV